MSGDHNQYQKPTSKDSLQVEAMKMAIEVVAKVASDESDEGQIAIAAYHALRQAIEQAEKQKQAAWVDLRAIEYVLAKGCVTTELTYLSSDIRGTPVPLYTAPQEDMVSKLFEENQRLLFQLSRAENQKPRLWAVSKDQEAELLKQREWVGLTEDEVEDIWDSYCDELGDAYKSDAQKIAQEIETLLKAKNHVS